MIIKWEKILSGKMYKTLKYNDKVHGKKLSSKLHEIITKW